MMTSSKTPQVFLLQNPRDKILALKDDLVVFSSLSSEIHIPNLPSRIAQVVDSFRGPKEKISSVVGQARLLHELANIELQAMELALRTYVEFPQAPALFRRELASLCEEESGHLVMCLDELERLGFQYGHWPVHLHLWQATSVSDSLLDRILIVHRYLEGSGLDSGAKILERLKSFNSNPRIREIVSRIHQDEVGHVDFGSRWYRKICEIEGLDPVLDFKARLFRLLPQLPKRVERLDRDSRQRAGFLEHELEVIEKVQLQWWL